MLSLLFLFFWLKVFWLLRRHSSATESVKTIIIKYSTLHRSSDLGRGLFLTRQPLLLVLPIPL